MRGCERAVVMRGFPYWFAELHTKIQGIRGCNTGIDISRFVLNISHFIVQKSLTKIKYGIFKNVRKLSGVVLVFCFRHGGNDSFFLQVLVEGLSTLEIDVYIYSNL